MQVTHISHVIIVTAIMCIISSSYNIIIILSDVYCEISQVVTARIAQVPKALVRCGALTTSDISQYALDNVFIMCQYACA